MTQMDMGRMKYALVADSILATMIIQIKKNKSLNGDKDGFQMAVNGFQKKENHRLTGCLRINLIRSTHYPDRNFR